jgi:UTP-glucose-1-phosphate uridylyltransferase
MNILIPMSGTGSRFVKAGYTIIKPLVPVFEKPIIKYIIEKFSKDDNFIFICREEHLEYKELKL